MPRARARPDSTDAIEAVEAQVARVAEVVLKLAALAERYEDTMGRIAPSVPRFADQQARVDTMRTAAERGRRRLVDIGRGDSGLSRSG